jgi:hypothetical protein
MAAEDVVGVDGSDFECNESAGHSGVDLFSRDKGDDGQLHYNGD